MGRNSVASTFGVVVLPAPLAPRNPEISPFSAAKLMPSTALILLSKTLVRAFASMMLILVAPFVLTFQLSTDFLDLLCGLLEELIDLRGGSRVAL